MCEHKKGVKKDAFFMLEFYCLFTLKILFCRLLDELWGSVLVFNKADSFVLCQLLAVSVFWRCP
jgi:hypothetical protein